ncbi:MAG: hypothetical protein ACLTQI_09395 [Slackia sp.]
MVKAADIVVLATGRARAYDEALRLGRSCSTWASTWMKMGICAMPISAPRRLPSATRLSRRFAARRRDHGVLMKHVIEAAQRCGA